MRRRCAVVRASMRSRLLLACCLAGLGAASHAAPAAPRTDYGAQLAQASAALDKGDYDGAYRAYGRHAGSNPLAQFMLGMMHDSGWGRPKDAAVACDWYAKAALARIPAAEDRAAACLLRGQAGDGAARRALDLYLRAAAGGHLISLCAASDLHMQGRGLPKDVETGLRLCAQAAQAGSPPAMMKMASYYRGHPDVVASPEAARFWLQQAAERGVNEARYRLAIMLSQGEGGAPDLPAALHWMESAAAEGYAPAYLPTATLYANQPPQPDNGLPAPEHLAKVYLWSSAARARLSDPRLLAGAERLLEQALALMPASWRPDLDRQVAEHLARFKPEA